MKRILFTLFLLMATLVLLAGCGDKKKPTETTTTMTIPAATTTATEETTYRITFSVNGVNTEVSCRAGELPIFTGPAEWTEGDSFYRIEGWDTEFVPVTGDTVYTATIGKYGTEEYQIYWNLKNGIVKTTVHAGETPVPPDNIPIFKTDDTVYTFNGTWSPAIVPAVKNKTVYNAGYDSSVRNYTVTFTVNGEVYETQEVPYGNMPTVPQNVNIPEGFEYVSWGTLKTVVKDGSYSAHFVNCDPDVYSILLDIKETDDISETSSAALYLALEEAKHPGEFADLLAYFLRRAVESGKEPDFDFTANFCYPILAAAFSVSKTLPSVWNLFSETEIAKFDFLMKCMAVQSALATDDSCTYYSGPRFKGNYSKVWNPNYRLSNVPQIIFCVSYFGSAEAVNRVLKDFDYDAYVAAFTEYGWTNALACWTRETTDTQVDYIYLSYTTNLSDAGNHRKATIVTNDGNGHYTLSVKTSQEDIDAGLTGYTYGQERIISYTDPKTMMMQGGNIYCMTTIPRISQYVGKSAGSGLGVPAIGQKGYSYGGHSLSDIAGIWNTLLTYTYSAGAVTSREFPDGNDYLCYIADRSTSPMQGLNGMMLEFHSGGRSSLSYCLADFKMVVAINEGLEYLSLYDPTLPSNESLSKLVWVGNTDCLYKAEHGYVSKSGNTASEEASTKYGEGSVYIIWRSVWLENGANEYTLSDIK